ncbi:hypothetical protein V8D89_006801 [Ganoderma adspersum]
MPKMSQDASRLQRLRQYSSKFASGSFDYEDFGTHHHDYVLQQLRILRWNTTMPTDSSFSNLYSQDCRSDLALSIFTPGSAQAGIQSSYCLIHIGTAGEPGLFITKWAIDDAQDLLVIAEYVLWELAVRHGDRPDLSFCVEACNWRTGEVISQIEVGAQLVDVVPLEYPYCLVVPRAPEACPHLSIYSFSESPSDIPIRTLQLPEQNTGERLVWHETSEGHFRADMSLSMVALTFCIMGPGPSPEYEYEAHLLIPRATLLSQARLGAAASRQADGSLSLSEPRPSVPWADWGPRGCLWLRLRPPQHTARRIVLIPFSSWMPLVVLDDRDFKSASVFVFDINPFFPRRPQQQALGAPQDDSNSKSDCESEERKMVGVIEDIEAVLPGVIDWDCSSIPYLAYRFKIELPDVPMEWEFGDAQVIRAVVMAMTGFTVKFVGVEHEKAVQTWTV